MKSILQYLAITAAGALVALTGHVSSALAQNVELVTKAEKEIEVVENGAKVKKLVPPAKMIPGDEVVYTITYSNKTKVAAEKVVVTNPVPQHTKYKDGTAAGDGADIVFSVDGGKNFATSDKLTMTIKDKAGKDITRPAVAQDYTHIRWTLKGNVASGATGTVRFRAVIQ